MTGVCRSHWLYVGSCAVFHGMYVDFGYMPGRDSGLNDLHCISKLL